MNATTVNYYKNSTTAGYHCPNCEMWVVGPHYCPGKQTYYSAPLSPLVVVDDETKELLKRIADALEKLVEK